MHEQDAQASGRASESGDAQADATHARTDARTYADEQTSSLPGSNASRAGGQSNSSSLDFFARRFLEVATDLDAASWKLAAVEALIDKARKVSPSPSMTVPVDDRPRR